MPDNILQQHLSVHVYEARLLPAGELILVYIAAVKELNHLIKIFVSLRYNVSS